MSYPEPCKLDSRDSLYRQAVFFYGQYEAKKKEIEKLKAALIRIREAISKSDYEKLDKDVRKILER